VLSLMPTRLKRDTGRGVALWRQSKGNYRSAEAPTQECRAEWPTGEIATSGYFEMFISQHSPQIEIKISESWYEFRVN